MKSHNIALNRLKRVTAIFILLLICMITATYATEINPGDALVENDTVVEEKKLPYIEMKVKTVTVEGTNQVLVEAWGSNYTCLEGVEILFTYDNTKLMPSYINGENTNEALSGLDAIKYENRPTTSSAQASFDIASRNLLSNSFAFDSAYAERLGIDIFRYLAPSENNEAIQFVISRKDYLNEISATDPVLLGTFSFKQTEDTILEENEFTTKRIKIYCDDGLTEDDYSYYTREESNGEDCTEIIEFTYEKYGSINGTIETGYYNAAGEYTAIGNKIATVHVYKAEDVENIDWKSTGSDYKSGRIETRPLLDGTYKLCTRPLGIEQANIKPVQSFTLSEENLGQFKIENLLFGNYVLVVDKLDYADYVITNITVDSNTKDIDVGKLEIIVGDFNKDGILDREDRTIFLLLWDQQAQIYEDLSMIAFDLDDNGAVDRSDRTIMLQSITSSMNNTIKKVNEWKTENEEI